MNKNKNLYLSPFLLKKAVLAKAHLPRLLQVRCTIGWATM
jgi:hypothetical protein